LFMNLSTLDKIFGIFNIKNEKTNLHRILSGMLEIHMFFIKGFSTNMCSYVNEWNIFQYMYMYFRYLIEKLVIHIIHFLHYFYKNILQKIKKNDFFDLLCTYNKNLLILFMNKYCI